MQAGDGEQLFRIQLSPTYVIVFRIALLGSQGCQGSGLKVREDFGRVKQTPIS